MLHKFEKNYWVWENVREDYTTPALFAEIMGTILGTNFIYLFYLFFIYLFDYSVYKKFRYTLNTSTRLWDMCTKFS